MGDIVITAEGLGKKYVLSHRQQGHHSYVALRDVLAGGVRQAFRKLTHPFATGHADGPSKEDFWALKDVSFEVGRGERIGIIGRNGAGKSTLLKILSRITEPTAGRARIRGRVASLLEVGTGFHPELTGRENVYLNGAILGMTRADIKARFDEIVAFAEVEKFLDTPVKRYSSGMYVRLAFAVAAHLEPEILIVDEVLAVGDAAFQKKCMGKMEDVSRGGRTVLFVSHNMAAVQKLCPSTVLIEQGGIKMRGETVRVIRKYLDGCAESAAVYDIKPPTDRDAPGHAHRLVIEGMDSAPATSIPVGRPWQTRVSFTISRRTEHFIIGLGMLTNEGLPVRSSWSAPRTIGPGEYQAVFKEKGILFGAGRYNLAVGLSSHERAFHFVSNAAVLTIDEYAEGVDLPRIAHSGVILNQMEVEIGRAG